MSGNSALRGHVPEHAHEQLSDLADADVLSADTGMPQIVDQATDELILVRIDVLKNLGQFSSSGVNAIRLHG